MNIAGIVLLGAGYLLGNPQARDKFFTEIQKIAGKGVDALNKVGGEPNVPTPNTDAEPEAE